MRAPRSNLLEPAYLLHHRPYRDTSRILEFFARGHGRITLFARGARRSSARLAPVLQPFNRLLISWSGRGEAGQLIGAEFDGMPRPMPAARLMSGFYLNELLLRLFEQQDAHAEVFDLYEVTLEALAASEANESRVLRLFEKRLLQALGYGLPLETDIASGRPVEAGRSYRFRLDAGPAEVAGVGEGSLIFSGATLLALAHEELEDLRILADARRLLRAAIDRCLDGRALRTREVASSLRRASVTTEKGV